MNFYSFFLGWSKYTFQNRIFVIVKHLRFFMEDKFHWYDGWFYDKFIAPNQDATFRIMLAMMEKDSTVIDVGCGTGRFVFQAGEKFNSVVGLDLSSRNINFANQLLSKTTQTNISFIHGNAEELLSDLDRKFDYSTISYVIHEMPEEIRLKTLNNLKEISNEIIIGDYFVPQPFNKRGISNRIAEVLAGKDHFKNFLSFVKSGGLPGLIEEGRMTMLQQKQGVHGTSLIVKVK